MKRNAASWRKPFEGTRNSPPKRILDAGCGTGGHAFSLAKRGYEVTGIDASEVMIDVAKEKSGKNGLNVDFCVMDIRNLQLDQKFDACICMFSVMNYLTTNEDVKKALSSIRKHLRKGSLFVFDFWYGPAVLSILPSQRVKSIEKRGTRVIRLAKPQLDTLHQLCYVEYCLIVIKENRIVDEAEEKHTIRFFLPEEIKHHLEENGFELLKICPFPKLDEEISDRDWDAAIISRAI